MADLVPSPPPPRAPRALLVVAVLLFPIALWAFTTLFFRGQIGPWNDDYFFTMRDPVTNGINGYVLTTREPYLPPTGHLNALRPWLHTVIPTILSLCWDHFWIAHLIGALGHGLAAILLYRILRGLGRSVHASAAAAIFFMIWAVHHEAWLWVSAYGTLFASLCFLTMTLCMIRFARSRERHDGAATGWPWALAIIFGAIGVLGFQEQACGAFPALMLVYWAARPEHERLAARIFRPAVPVAIACALVPAYLWLVARFAQPGIGNKPETYERPGRMFNRTMDVVKGFIENIALERFGSSAATRGWRMLLDDKPTMLTWLGTLAALALLAWWVWYRTPMQGPGSPPRRPARVWATFLFGICAFLGCCLPIAVIVGYPTNSRVTYLPFACLLISFTCLLDAVACLFHPLCFVPGAISVRADQLAARYRFITGLGLAFVFIFGGVMSIGAMSKMREVVRADERNGRQLLNLIPDPKPGTVFLPVSIRPRAFNTRNPAFDEDIRSVWERLWSMKYFVKFVYRRDDVWSLGAARGLPILVGADAEKAEYIWPFGVPYYDPKTERAPIPWEFIIPITFDELGNVRIVTRLVQHKKAGPPVIVEIEQAKGQPELQFDLPPID